MKIKFVPNEDGFGPTIGTYYLVRGFLEVAKNSGTNLEITVQNHKGYGIAQPIYKELQDKYGIEIHLIQKKGVIELGKREDGRLDFQKTYKNLLGYEKNSTKYAQEEDLSGYSAVISFGSPEIILAAHQTSEKSGQKIHAFEVFDHSWSLTLEKIMKDEMAKKEGINLEDDTALQRAIKAIQKHEGMTERVFLFPEFLTSSEYYCHWKRVIGYEKADYVTRFNGVLGGYGKRERKQKRKEYRKEISEKLNLPNLKDNNKIVVIQAGGTPVWDAFLIQIIGDCVRMDKQKLLGHYVLFSEKRVNDLIEPKRFEKRTKEEQDAIKDLLNSIPNTEYVRLLSTEFSDWQNVYVASDLIFSRAGGMTVQDAVACRTPVVCVDEPGQWQTEKIKETCRLHGISSTVWYEAFKGAAIGPVERHLVDKATTSESVEFMKKYSVKREEHIGKKILEIISSNN